jgi:iron-sulfur cluster repair protein YtfE (RIC family)
MTVPDSRTLREILRARPAAVATLEDSAGQDFWNHLDTRLTDYGQAIGIPEPRLSAGISAAARPLATDDFAAKPLWYLVEFLTENHRDFRSKDLPELQRLFDLLRLEFAQEPRAIDGFVDEFTDFRRELAWHLDEEEEFLFPKALRTEASLRHPELYPEVFKGSVTMFPRTHLRIPEENFRQMLAELDRKFHGLITDLRQLPIVRRILEAMQAFSAKLKTHTYLEADILFPRVAEMETELLHRNGRTRPGAA